MEPGETAVGVRIKSSNSSSVLSTAASLLRGWAKLSWLRRLKGALQFAERLIPQKSSNCPTFKTLKTHFLYFSSHNLNIFSFTSPPGRSGVAGRVFL
ncbi:uncharacterized protein J3R85_003235 [Psidium guajava]|nr:uncharacterized protein J3R85_003235 [Psidium guajava]